LIKIDIASGLEELVIKIQKPKTKAKAKPKAKD
jgi:hypothetical protein